MDKPQALTPPYYVVEENGSDFVLESVPPGVQVDPSSVLSAVSSPVRSSSPPGRHTSSLAEPEWEGVKFTLLEYTGRGYGVLEQRNDQLTHEIDS